MRQKTARQTQCRCHNQIHTPHLFLILYPRCYLPFILYSACLTSSASPVYPPEHVCQSCQRKGDQQRSHYCTCDATHWVTSRPLGQHPSHHEQENDLDPHTTISQRRHDTQKKRYYVLTPPQLPPMFITAQASRMWTSTVNMTHHDHYVHITSSAFGSCGTVRLCYKVLSTRNRQSNWMTTFWSYSKRNIKLKLFRAL